MASSTENAPHSPEAQADWRVALVTACVIAVVIGAVTLWPSGDRARLQGREIAFVTVPDGATARAVIAPDSGGSLVQLEATGLDPETTYALWLSPAVADWEDRVPAGTFRVDSGGDVDVRLASALPPDRTARVWATDEAGALVLDTQ